MPEGEKKRLYLIRHALPDYPGGERTCLGRKLDLPLGEAGREQAAVLCRAFEQIPVDCVFSSPLARARQTAESLRKGPVHLLEDLTELDGGVWDGLPFREIHKRYPEYFIPGAPCPVPPGGETDEAGAARGMAALKTIANTPGHVFAAVAHASLNWLILASLTGTPFSLKKRIPQPCACVNVLEFDGAGWQVMQSGVHCLTFHD